MPCYEVRTVSVEFKVGNIEILKKALAADGWLLNKMSNSNNLYARHKDSGQSITINMEKGNISSKEYSEKELTTVTNAIKRAYSGAVIGEVAQRQKWIKKKLDANRYQLQRF